MCCVKAYGAERLTSCAVVRWHITSSFLTVPSAVRPRRAFSQQLAWLCARQRLPAIAGSCARPKWGPGDREYHLPRLLRCGAAACRSGRRHCLGSSLRPLLLLGRVHPPAMVLQWYWTARRAGHVKRRHLQVGSPQTGPPPPWTCHQPNPPSSQQNAGSCCVDERRTSRWTIHHQQRLPSYPPRSPGWGQG